MFSGLSRIKEKLRLVLLSCGEETLRSRRMSSILSIRSRSVTYSFSAEKGSWMMEKRGLLIVFVTAIVCGSRSIVSKRFFSLSCERIRRE